MTAPDPHPWRRLTRGYYTIAALYTLSASIIWGVNTLFLLDAGLDFFEVFIANAAFTGGMVVFEIPTGVVADTMGRRASFLLSAATLAAATILYVVLAEIQAGVVPFAVVSVFLGLGFTFYSGAVEAWIVDALRHSSYDGDLDHVFARGQLVSGAAMLVGTVSGGLLGQIDLAVPFMVRTLMLGVVFAVAFAQMHDLGFQPRPMPSGGPVAAMKSVAAASIGFGWRRPRIRLLMAVSFVNGGFFVWAFYAWQPYFLELLSEDAVWVAGVVSALIALSMMAGNEIVDWLTGHCGRRTTMLLWAAGLQTGAAVVVGLTTSFTVAVSFFLLIMVAMGITAPVRQAYIHRVVASEHRATVVSFDSMIGSLGGTGGQLGLGALGRSQGIGPGFVVGGAVTALALPLLMAARRLGGSADIIVGRRAGAEGTGACQGVPAVASVQSQAREIFAGD